VVRFTPKGAGCIRWKDGCTFSIWREQYGKELKDAHIKELVENRRTKLIKGFKKKDGKDKYDACLVLNEECKVRLDFGDGAKPVDTAFGACPQCKEGNVRPNSKGVGCSRWKEGCTFFIWREQAGVMLTDDHIKQLIENKTTTEQVQGFKKKDGSGTYNAFLILNEQWKVRLHFGVRAATPDAAPSPTI
jgi:DNA topoisomerase-3